MYCNSVGTLHFNGVAVSLLLRFGGNTAPSIDTVYLHKNLKTNTPYMRAYMAY